MEQLMKMKIENSSLIISRLEIIYKTLILMQKPTKNVTSII